MPHGLPRSQRDESHGLGRLNTHSGYSAIKLASYRPKANIYAFTGNDFILNALSLVWGVGCVSYDKFVSTDHTIADTRYMLKKTGLCPRRRLHREHLAIPMEERGMSAIRN